MPFGIDLVFDSDTESGRYVIPEETEPVNVCYPNFMKWVKSGGAQNKDWYLHPKT